MAEFLIKEFAMSHMFRFYLDSLDLTISEKEKIILQGEENLHLNSTLRLKEGEKVELFNGKGLIITGIITETKKKKSIIEASQITFVEKNIKPQKILAIGALKPKSIDELLPYLTELGIDEIIFFLHGQIAKKRIDSKLLERWQKIVISASKQCKRPFLPTIRTETNLQAVCAYANTLQGKNYFLKAPEINRQKYVKQSSFNSDVQENLFCVVGSEEGLSSVDETFLENQFFKPITLGTNILRSVTASIAIASILSNF